MREHHLKSWPQFFTSIMSGERVHELRRNDRDFEIGDVLVLREFDPRSSAFTGRQCSVEITSMTSADRPCAVSDQGLHPDFCILSIRVMSSGGRRRGSARELQESIPR